MSQPLVKTRTAIITMILAMGLAAGERPELSHAAIAA
jgi:hypothetical protein